jgi:hypothetical protein
VDDSEVDQCGSDLICFLLCSPRVVRAMAETLILVSLAVAALTAGYLLP